MAASDNTRAGLFWHTCWLRDELTNVVSRIIQCSGQKVGSSDDDYITPLLAVVVLGMLVNITTDNWQSVSETSGLLDQ
jgi:hypothetical protein